MDTKECNPKNACETHGRCWTHSDWDEDLEDQTMNDLLNSDVVYSEWESRFRWENQDAMDESYRTGEYAVDDWNIRYEDWSDECMYDSVPF